MLNGFRSSSASTAAENAAYEAMKAQEAAKSATVPMKREVK
jgi:hypothetical protein